MTTIVSVRRGDQVVIGGDGQVSLGNTVMKGNARKVRRLYNGQVIAGFAGGTADAFTLFEKFEAQLQHPVLLRPSEKLPTLLSGYPCRCLCCISLHRTTDMGVFGSASSLNRSPDHTDRLLTTLIVT